MNAQRVQTVIRIGCVLAAILAGGTAVAESGNAAQTPQRVQLVAQFGLGDLVGAGKDLAVKSALSAFGKSLGDQLPIVVAANDAYPTVPSLPGAAFAPADAPDISAALRASRDGTIALPPGDYEFPVGVFCMRATSGSPPGHRYLVAPLRGSAADIVTALDARIPSYPTDHHVLQVLSWDIQAGMAYSAMQPDQRAAVDRIIPDYRSRLNGDVYQNIRDQYQKTAGSVPGMPSFEDALTRIGPVGAQVVALQNLRQQLAQPPPTFDELARRLVPILPAPKTPEGAGPTPWSRYSDRVFVRFVTDGNYATPGTYQVRVLAPAGSAAPGPAGAAASGPLGPSGSAAPASAGVPFTNTVNNPGSDAIQPLTQTPSAPVGYHPPGPRARPTPPEPKIISETAATIPANRARTLIGVGELVMLTFTGGSALWHINGLGGMLQPVGPDTALYRAAPQAAYETITATGVHGSATISFQVIPPTGVIDRVVEGTLDLHHHDRPDSGVLVHTFLTPDTVSFQFILVIEREVGAVGSGVFLPFNNIGHHPLDVFLPVGPVVPGLGSPMQSVDTAYSGDPCTAPPFAPGTLVFYIPYEYELRGTTQSYLFPRSVVQTSEVLLGGSNVQTAKAGAFMTGRTSDPTTTARRGCADPPDPPPAPPKKAKH